MEFKLWREFLILQVDSHQFDDQPAQTGSDQASFSYLFGAAGLWILQRRYIQNTLVPLEKMLRQRTLLAEPCCHDIRRGMTNVLSSFSDAASIVVLIGGGHTHALVLKELQKRKIRLSRLILISDCAQSPYSGLLTGQIAGIYKDSEIYIDIEKLTHSVHGSFVEDAVIGIDFNSQEVETERHGKIRFDILSLNCGARPDLSGIPGANRNSHGVKPTRLFQTQFNEFLKTASQEKYVRMVQIGGGVAGVECATGYRRRLEDLGVKAEITLIDSGFKLLPQHNSRVRAAVTKMLSSLEISVWTGETVEIIEPGQLRTKNGRTLSFDFAAQATSAQPQDWVRKLDLEHSGNFIQVNGFLLTSRLNVFAVGDVALNPEFPVPRAGVYAVREAPVLLHNLLATLKKTPLKRYIPQKKYLNLIMDGHGRAVASRGWFYFPRSRLMWKLKDWIDRDFVRKLNQNDL